MALPDVRHGTLVASTVATETMEDDVPSVEVVNVDGVSAIYFTVNGVVPTVAGADCYVLPAVAGASLMVPPNTSGATAVKIISAGTPKYSVAAYPHLNP